MEAVEASSVTSLEATVETLEAVAVEMLVAAVEAADAVVAAVAVAEEIEILHSLFKFKTSYILLH